MLAEIGISEETFAEACIKATSNPTHKMLLSEIMAVDNFMAFKKLMVKRNKDLSEEALQILHAREAGIDPDMLYEQQNYGGNSAAEEEEIAKAIQASLELEEAKKSGKSTTPQLSEEDEMLRRVLEESKREYERSQEAKMKAEEDEKAQAPQKIEIPKKAEKVEKSVKKVEKPKPKPTKEASLAKIGELPAMKAPKTLAPIDGAKAAAVAHDFDIQKHAEETAKIQKKNEEKKTEELQKKTMTKEEMKERMEKLKKQRDLLLRKKQEQLQKEWEEYDHKDSSSGDSRKDMIQKGLAALQIKESDTKYKTEEEKKAELEKYKADQKKKKEEAKLAKERFAKIYHHDHSTNIRPFLIINLLRCLTKLEQCHVTKNLKKITSICKIFIE